ncbi:MAG: nucleotide exchange factor GrpE [Pseudomonadota bacterium]
MSDPNARPETPETPDFDAAEDAARAEAEDAARAAAAAYADAAEATGGEGDDADPRTIIAGLQDEISKVNDQRLRIAAELDNTRRRAEREKAEAAQYGIQKFARDLLTVADTFERALQAAPAEGEEIDPAAVPGLIMGVRMTEKELLTVFERHGVRRLAPKGEKFDPNFHQAIAEAPDPDTPSGHVSDVAQPGFAIGDRVLRAAMVVVSKG